MRRNLNPYAHIGGSVRTSWVFSKLMAWALLFDYASMFSLSVTVFDGAIGPLSIALGNGFWKMAVGMPMGVVIAVTKVALTSKLVIFRIPNRMNNSCLRIAIKILGCESLFQRNFQVQLEDDMRCNSRDLQPTCVSKHPPGSRHVLF